MKKHVLLLGILSCVSWLLPSFSVTHASDPVLLQKTICGHANGTGTSIELNSMPYSRILYGLTSGDWVGDYDSRIFPSCNSGTCFEPNCIIAAVGDDRIKETHFLTGRKCSGSCGTEPVAQNSTPDGPVYDFSAGNFAVGDTLRALVYIHNTADPSDPSLVANNATVAIDWSGNSLSATANADNAALKNSASTVSFSLPSGTTFVPTQYFVRKYNSASYTFSTVSSGTLSPTGSENISVNLGTLGPCFLNARMVYIDLEVVNNDVCGDGTVNGDEICDDGSDNLAAGVTYGTEQYHCSHTCQLLPYCRDDVVQPTEETCDDGDDNLAQGVSYGAENDCLYDCDWAPFCGDDVVQPTEETCDDGDDNLAQGVSYGTTSNFCSSDCNILPYCGDDTVDGSFGEECDDGVLNGTPGYCTITCHLPAPEFTVEKMVQSYNATSGVVTYEILVENTGDTDFDHLVLNDELDDGLTFQGFVGTSYSMTTTDVGFSLLLESLPTGTGVGIIFSATVDAGATGTLCNNVVSAFGYTTAGSTPEYPAASILNGNNNNNGACITIDNPEPGLSIEKHFSLTANGPYINPPDHTLEPGDSVFAHLIVTNTGDVDLGPINVSDPLDPNFLHNGSNNPIQYSIVSLAPDAVHSQTFELTVADPLNPPSATQICNPISGSPITATTMFNGQTVQAIFATPLCFPLNSGGNNPGLSIEKTAVPISGTTVEPGDLILYTITVTNTGDIDLHHVVAADQLPDQVEFVSVISGNVTHNNGVVVVQFGTLPVGQSDSATFQVRVKENPQVKVFCNSQVGADADELTDPVLLTDPPCHTVVVPNPPSFEVTKIIDSVENDKNFYTISIENTGDETLRNVTILDEIDQQTTFGEWLSGPPMPDITGNTFTWIVPELSADEIVNGKFWVSINAGASGEICNKITAATAEIGFLDPPQIIDGIINVPPEGICTTISNAPGYTLVKSATPPNGSTVAPGQLITYTLTVNITGNVPLENIVVVDQLDPNVTYIDGGISQPGVNTVTLNFCQNACQPGDTESKNFVVQVNNPTTADTVCNFAIGAPADNFVVTSAWQTVTQFTRRVVDGVSEFFGNLFSKNATIPDTPNSVVGGDDVVSNVVCHQIDTPEIPSIKIEKGAVPASGSTVVFNDTITFRLTATNDGTVDLTDVTVTDELVPALLGDEPSIVAAGGTLTGQVVQFLLGSIPAGDVRTVTFDVLINECLTSLPNAAKVVATYKTADDVVAKSNTTNHTCDGGGGDDCGDGDLDPGEECDDGNNTSGDGCSATCTLEFCGNGVLDPGEQCDDGNNISGDGCSATCTTEGGSGGTETHPSIGVCHQNPNSEHFGCLPMNEETVISEQPTVKIEDLETFQNCLDNPETPGSTVAQQECWCLAEGLTANWDEIIAHQNELSLFHGTFVEQFCTAAQSGNTCSWLTNNQHWPFVMSEDCGILPSCNCPPELATRINKTANRTAARYFDNNNFETVDYTVELEINRDDIVDPTVTHPVKFSEMTVKIYDLTIPAEGGALWNRAGITSNSGAWTWHEICEEGKVGGCFEKSFTTNDPELARLDQNQPVDLKIQYTMDTGLAIDTDTAKVANVAFATVTASYAELVDLGDGTFQPSTLHTNDQTCFAKNGGVEPGTRFGDVKNDVLDEMENSGLGTLNSSSLGSTWVVQLVRPYIEARSGANVSIASATKLTGQQGVNTGQVFTDDDAEKLSGLGSDFENEETPLRSYENNIDPDNFHSFFNTEWLTTPDQTGVYFLDPELEPSSLILTTDDLPENVSTFVIDGKNVVITENFEPEKLHAFIVQNGDLQIAPTVTKIHGLFIVENGEILSGTGAVPAEQQLELRGALMGNATDLLTSRTWIGDRSAPLNPDFKMEPSIRILFDLDVLDATPPAIEGYLGSDWTQQ